MLHSLPDTIVLEELKVPELARNFFALWNPDCRYEVYISLLLGHAGTRWGSWLGHCVTNRKVAGWNTYGGHWNSSSAQSYQLHYNTGADLACNRNEYQGFSLELKAAGALAGLYRLHVTIV